MINDKIYLPKIGDLIKVNNLSTGKFYIDIVTQINYFKRTKKKDLPISFYTATSNKRTLVKQYTIAIEIIQMLS